MAVTVDPPRTMVPPPTLLPDVLPTERLGVTGKAIPEIRAELRRIPVARNVAAIASVYAQSVGLIALAGATGAVLTTLEVFGVR